MPAIASAKRISCRAIVISPVFQLTRIVSLVSRQDIKDVDDADEVV